MTVKNCEPRFDPHDVWKVARALLGNAINYEVTCGMNAYNECAYCSGHVYWNQDADTIQHDHNCPVQIARDLLVGATENAQN